MLPPPTRHTLRPIDRLLYPIIGPHLALQPGGTCYGVCKESQYPAVVAAMRYRGCKPKP